MGDPDAERIAREIEALPLPDDVIEIRLELNDDWIGEPAVFLCVVAREGMPHIGSSLWTTFTRPIDEALTEAMLRYGGNRFPYIAFRAAQDFWERGRMSRGKEKEIAKERKPGERRRGWWEASADTLAFPDHTLVGAFHPSLTEMEILARINDRLERDAELNPPGLTPLHLAARNGFVRVTERLLEVGANPLADRQEQKSQPFHEALLSGADKTTMPDAARQIAEMMIQRGADVNAPCFLNPRIPLADAALR